MRELKFRAWEERFKRFAYFTIRQLMEDEAEFVFTDSPVEQFTGLHDKNGVEIFEGDIVHWWWGNKPAGDWGPPGVVSFGTFSEDLASIVGPGWIVEDCFLNEECEVIGNIHENPELLEST